MVFCDVDYMVDSVSVLVVEVIELLPVDSVIDSEVPSTSGGCNFLRRSRLWSPFLLGVSVFYAGITLLYCSGVGSE